MQQNSKPVKSDLFREIVSITRSHAILLHGIDPYPKGYCSAHKEAYQDLFKNDQWMCETCFRAAQESEFIGSASSEYREES